MQNLDLFERKNLSLREAHNNKSNVLVQAWYLCRSMSVKSSTGECLSNYLVKVSCNCWERTFNIACGLTLSKKNLPKQRRKSFISNCSLIPLFLNKKWKWKHRILRHLHIIQKSPLVKTRESHFSLVWLMECSTTSPCLG